jgi:hypothetical protein
MAVYQVFTAWGPHSGHVFRLALAYDNLG